LSGREAPPAEQSMQKIQQLEALLKSRQPDLVKADDLLVLNQMEQQEGQRRDIEEFKFPTNEEMLNAIRSNKAASASR
jgi:hypothetical protein